MALKNSINFKGFVVNDSYVRISQVTGDKTNILLIVKVYKSQADYMNVSEELDTIHYVFVPSVQDNSENFIRQGYEYLKSLEEYKNSIDC